MSISDSFEGGLMKAIRSLEQHADSLLSYDFSHLTKEELYRMEQADIREAVWDNLPDICQIEIDKKKPVPQRAQEYVQKVGNPFLVRVGAYTVKLGYYRRKERAE